MGGFTRWRWVAFAAPVLLAATAVAVANTAQATTATTDATGKVQFTAVDNVAETVTYTALDVSDGNLPVPGRKVLKRWVPGGRASGCYGGPDEKAVRVLWAGPAASSDT